MNHLIISEVVAQATSGTGDWSALIAQLGFGGMILLVVSRWLERIDHTLKGLSMALWTDLASRPQATDYIKETAKNQIARMEANKR